MKLFFKLFSIDEMKISALIVCLLTGFIFSLYSYQIHGDITNSLLDLLKTIIYAITGINVTNGISSIANVLKNKGSE